MRSRTRNWIVALGLLDVLVIVLTLHAHLRFHHTRNGPSVMTLGQALGWLVSVALLVLIVLILTQAGRTGPRRR